MSHEPSRKQFFAKLLGFAASVAILPKFLATSAPALSSPNGPALSPPNGPDLSVSNGPGTPAAPVVLRPETRAIARRADSI